MSYYKLMNPRGHITSACICPVRSPSGKDVFHLNVMMSFSPIGKSDSYRSLTAARRAFSQMCLSPKQHGSNVWAERPDPK